MRGETFCAGDGDDCASLSLLVPFGCTIRGGGLLGSAGGVLGMGGGGVVGVLYVCGGVNVVGGGGCDVTGSG